MSCDSYVKCYDLRYGGRIAKHNESNRGKDEFCDLFLPQSCYDISKIKISETKDYNISIGIQLLKEKAELFDWLCAIDWAKLVRPSPSGQQHITRPVVFRAVIAGGFED